MARLINCRQLRQLYDKMGPRDTCRHLGEALAEKHLRPQDFSIRDLAEVMVPDGGEFVRLLDPRAKSGGIDLLEAGYAVDTSAFTNITGQVVYSEVLAAFQDDVFIGDDVMTTVSTRFNGEKIPGIGRMGDKAEAIGEGKPYPSVGLSEEYVETPTTTKRGFIVPITKEAIFFDRTNVLLDRAAEVGRWLGLNKEKRILDTVLGVTNTYNRNGTTTNTYLSSGAYVNIKASNALVDWTDIEAAELLLDAITDPNTSEPVMIQADTLIVPSALRFTAMRVVNATEVRHGDITASPAIQSVSANPVSGAYNIKSSRYVKQRTGSDSTWFLGAPKRAFRYMENWPITVVQARDNSEAEFNQDIVVRYKASERGAPAVIEPRYVVKCTA